MLTVAEMEKKLREEYGINSRKELAEAIHKMEKVNIAPFRCALTEGEGEAEPTTALTHYTVERRRLPRLCEQ